MHGFEAEKRKAEVMPHVGVRQEDAVDRQAVDPPLGVHADGGEEVELSGQIGGDVDEESPPGCGDDDGDRRDIPPA